LMFGVVRGETIISRVVFSRDAYGIAHTVLNPYVNGFVPESL
jgi:hypothetical protein